MSFLPRPPAPIGNLVLCVFPRFDPGEAAFVLPAVLLEDQAAPEVPFPLFTFRPQKTKGR